ncbi:MAG: polyprenyl synthetase family protein [Phycisphaerae bacterium]|nr:polyprenyl synthetase family protein [Phycisphaerae bacterium]
MQQPDRELKQTLNYIKEDLDHVFEVLDAEISDCDRSFFDLLGTFHPLKGKMIRPALVLLSAKLTGSVNKQHYFAAAAIQTIHHSTLLHDDVIDNAPLRRSKPTANVLCGNEFAVLLGDLLLSKAIKLCVKLPTELLIKFADATCDICQGELTQTNQKNKWDISEKNYLSIITKKTASLFSLCCHCGAYLTNASAEKIKLMELFGKEIGISFQITDDILDITGEVQKTGKIPGADLKKRKLTLPVIHLLNSLRPAEKKNIVNLLKNQNNAPDIDSLRDLLNEHNSIEYANSVAKKFAQKAISRLRPFNDSESKQHLVKIAEYTADRLR